MFTKDFKYRQIINLALKAIRIVVHTAIICIAVWIICWMLVCDRFTINGPSMMPTFQTGERIWVNKTIMGARIYKKFDFDSAGLSCFRMPGFRHLKEGDIVVFNYPQGWEKGKIGFKINYVFCKRCLGCPGDTIRIAGGRYVNNGHYVPSVPDHFQDILSKMPDSLARQRGVVLHAMAFKRTGWTIKDFGPLPIPAKGSVIRLDPVNRAVYKKEIEYETGMPIKEIKDSVYRFTGNWYFVGGDNVLDSRDSRYFGLVPEDFIVGVVSKNRCVGEPSGD